MGRTTGFGVPGPMTQDRSWKVTLWFIQSVALKRLLWPPPQLLNLLPLVRLRTSPHSRRYGVTITGFVGYRLSGRSVFYVYYA